jgi:hypothetical protein
MMSNLAGDGTKFRNVKGGRLKLPCIVLTHSESRGAFYKKVPASNLLKSDIQRKSKSSQTRYRSTNSRLDYFSRKAVPFGMDKPSRKIAF